MINLTPEQAHANASELLAYDGIVRGKWQSRDAEGRRQACWLGAIHPDIKSSDDCPGDIMPDWLVGLASEMGDNVSAENWHGFTVRYVNLLPHLHKLTDAQSRVCLLRVLDASLRVAEPHDTANVVAPVRALIARELAGGEVTNEEWLAAASGAEAAEAAGAEAWAAETAGRAAWAAGVNALVVVVALAAAIAARAARAKAAAWDTITEACLTALEEALGIGAAG